MCCCVFTAVLWAQLSHYFATLVCRHHVYVIQSFNRPEKYTIKPERKEIAAVSIDLTRHDDFQGPRKLEVGSLYSVFFHRKSQRRGKLETAALCVVPEFVRYTSWYMFLDIVHAEVRLFFLKA